MTTEFDAHVEAVAKDFLQTVLLIDDEAFRLGGPDGGTSTDGEDWTAGGVPGHLQAGNTPPEMPDALDIRAVSVAFARGGLSCAVLSPQNRQENEDLQSAFVEAAKRVDALILDWNLNGDSGATAKSLIRAVLEGDMNGGEQRLRVVVIYTGEKDLPGFANHIAVAIRDLGDDETVWDEGKAAFTRGPMRVAVYAKEHVDLPVGLDDLRRSISQLPDVITTELARHCKGLLASACLSALTGVRANAHRLLAAYDPELDAAVLGQRAALPNPSDVERQVESLIMSEIGAIIQDKDVGAQVGMDTISMWLAHHVELDPRGISTELAMTADRRARALAEGFGAICAELKGERGMSDRKITAMGANLTSLFVTSEQQRERSDHRFEVLMSMQSRYSNPTPTLHLGTVLERDGSYVVCVQPMCDSVRIEDARNFPMLPLKIVQDGGNNSNHLPVITIARQAESADYVRLRLDPAPHLLEMERFAASSGQVVQAMADGGSFWFSPCSGQPWRWVGDLKPLQAQRMVERLSSTFSRVGLEEAQTLLR